MVEIELPRTGSKVLRAIISLVLLDPQPTSTDPHTLRAMSPVTFAYEIPDNASLSPELHVETQSASQAIFNAGSCMSHIFLFKRLVFPSVFISIWFHLINLLILVFSY